MSMLRIALLGAALAALAAPADLAAQGHGNGHGKAKGHEQGVDDDDPWDDDDRLDDDDVFEVRRADGDRVIVVDRDGRIVIGRRDVDRRYRIDKPGKGPAFCRSGAGHPVHGRRWCLEKGFGLGRRGDVWFDRDDEVVLWNGDDEMIVVRDRRLDRDRSIWERVLDTVLVWSD